MPEGITLKRIIDMDETQQLSSSDYVLVDSSSGGNRKYNLGEDLNNLKDDLTTVKSDVTDLKDGLTELNEDFLDSLIVDTASGAIASFPDGADNVPVKSLTVAVEPVQSGSGDPSPTNVRPISGWTQAKATRTGVNVWDEQWELGYYANGAKANSSINIRCKSPIPVCGNTVYYVRYPDEHGARIQALDGDGAFISDLGYKSNATFTTPANCRYIVFYTNAVSSITTYNHDISINYPSTDHDYHAGHVQPLTISLGQTVYGGTLDVTTGVLTVDRAIVDLGTLNWTYSSAYGFYSTGLTGLVEYPSAETVVGDLVCSARKTGAWRDLDTYGKTGNIVAVTHSGTTDYLGITDNTYTSPSDFKTSMSGVQLVYKLAQSQTVQLTPQEVKTLLGANNIYADTGNSTVQYRADTKLYIEKLTAPTEDDMIADHAISSGTFFMVGNNLYRATTAIASGATITVGTNATRLSLSDALNALS